MNSLLHLASSLHSTLLLVDDCIDLYFEPRPVDKRAAVKRMLAGSQLLVVAHVCVEQVLAFAFAGFADVVDVAVELSVVARVRLDDQRVFAFDWLHVTCVLMHQQVLVVPSVCVCVAVDALLERSQAVDHVVAADGVSALRVERVRVVKDPSLFRLVVASTHNRQVVCLFVVVVCFCRLICKSSS